VDYGHNSIPEILVMLSLIIAMTVVIGILVIRVQRSARGDHMRSMSHHQGYTP
jgi:hypothetical protein